MTTKRSEWAKETKLNHPVQIDLQEGNRPLIQPVYHSAKFALSDQSSYWDQFVYGRISNPTTRQLEFTLAEMQERQDCIVLSSGISAVTGTFLGLLNAGDHIITFRELYKPTRLFIQDILKRLNITHTILCLSDLDRLESSIIKDRTKLIHFESPSNPNLEIADISRILEIAHSHNVLVSMDGTFAGLHQHTSFPVDIMIHSLTKFGNGHGDVIAGSIAGNIDIIKRIRETTSYLGAHLDPQAAYLIQRGLKTYHLRYERQVASAFKVAKFLETHPHIKIVRYPGLEMHHNHQLAKKQMQDMGAIVSFEVDHELFKNADEFCHRLKLIQFAASLGSTESIICPSLPFFGTDLSLSDREEMGINPYSVRLSVGLENPEDLIRDLEEALTV